MNHHLDIAHGITKQNPYVTKAGSQSDPDNPIHQMYAQAIQKLQFNKNLFKALLIQWICSNNICFGWWSNQHSGSCLDIYLHA